MSLSKRTVNAPNWNSSWVERQVYWGILNSQHYLSGAERNANGQEGLTSFKEMRCEGTCELEQLEVRLVRAGLLVRRSWSYAGDLMVQYREYRELVPHGGRFVGNRSS